MLVKGTQDQTPWDKQIIGLLSKAGRRIHILQVCKKYGYSLDLFHGLIIPLPIYGISLWGTASYNNNNNNNDDNNNNNNNNNSFICIAVYTKALYRFTIKKRK